MPSKPGIHITWESRDGVDPSVHFIVSESGVSRLTGKGWSTTKKVGKGLGSIVALAGVLTGRIGYGPWSLSQHYLSGKSEDKQFMRWKDVRRMAVSNNEGIISLYDQDKTEIRLRCTPDTFEPVLRTIRERATSIQQDGLSSL